MILRPYIRSATIGAGVAIALAAGDTTVYKTAVAADQLAVASDKPANNKKTMGFALVSWAPAMVETPDGKAECPSGFVQTNRDNWEALNPTDEARKAFIDKQLYLGPDAAGGIIPDIFYQERGPNGESVLYNPTHVKDAPHREVQSKISYGMNLDGTADGHATPKTCKHEKFTQVDGEGTVDNQIYRLLGCIVSWRKGGYKVDRNIRDTRVKIVNRMLLEISDVDDEQNDDHVVVNWYKGIDRVQLDAAGKPIPFAPQRIDVRYPKYSTTTTGKIVNGVLETDPVDQYMSLLQGAAVTDRHLLGMRLKLKLGPNGADGLVGGYEDLPVWWKSYSSSYSLVIDTIGLWSPPAMYEAAHRLADGYPDPKTGQCTALSAGYKIETVRSYVVHPRPDDPLVTDANMKAAERTVHPAPAS